jgi:hypothetical protein
MRARASFATCRASARASSLIRPATVWPRCLPINSSSQYSPGVTFTQTALFRVWMRSLDVGPGRLTYRGQSTLEEVFCVRSFEYHCVNLLEAGDERQIE